MDRGIAEKHAEDAARAQRRREAARAASEVERWHARKHSKRCSSKTPPIEMDEDACTVVEDEPLVAHQPSAAEDFNHMVLDIATEHLADDAEEPHVRAGSQATDSARGSILDHISCKQPRRRRMRQLSLFCQQGRKNDRLKRLILARRDEFELLPEEERTSLRAAFEEHDRDGSGSLDPTELVGCLADLGIAAASDVEARELLRVCHEVAVIGDVDFLNFALDLVPRAQARLRELQREPLLQEFRFYDTDGSSYLDDGECQQILHRLCTCNLDSKGLAEMQGVFDRAVATAVDDQGHIDFEGFQDLIGVARIHQRRVAAARQAAVVAAHGLTAEDVRRHADDMVVLHESFERALDGGTELPQEEVMNLLIEYGLLPHALGMGVATQVFSAVDSNGDGRIAFREFLCLVDRMKRQHRENEACRLATTFERLDKNRDARLDMHEISAMLAEVGLLPRCRHDQIELRRLLAEIDTDGSGDLCFEEFLSLAQRLRGRWALQAPRRQRVAAERFGLAEKRVAELRVLFWKTDVLDRGVLDLAQLRSALNALRKPMCPEQLRSLYASASARGGGDHLVVLAQCDSAGNAGEGADRGCDFEHFLFFCSSSCVDGVTEVPLLS